MKNQMGQCLLCKGEKTEVLFERSPYTIYKCLSCHLGFLFPQPTKDDLHKLYEKSYFAEQYDIGVSPDSPEFDRWLSLLEHRVNFFKRKKKKGTLLDIGCGNGYFLALCKKKGYDVQGLDISKFAAKYAINTLNLPIMISEISDADFQAAQFDIITLWHFLEHTQDPIQVIQSAKKWLKKNGIIIIEVPNFTGTDAQNQWDNWIGWQIPYHFYHFSPETLTKLLHLCGFTVIKFKDFHSETVKEKLSRYPLLNLFARLIAKRYSGHSILVMAELTP